MDNLEELVQKALQQIEAVNDEASLDAVRVQYLGKKGCFTDLMKGLSTLSPEERPKRGAEVNVAKNQVMQAINAKRDAMAAEASRSGN